MEDAASAPRTETDSDPGYRERKVLYFFWMSQSIFEMSLSTGIAFWTLFSLGPIPIWHLLLYSLLPRWRSRPKAFYSLCAAVWALFWPLSVGLAWASQPLFPPNDGLRIACLGMSLGAFGVALWSIKALTPRRFFLWAVLTPERNPAEPRIQGPYRFVRHPAYLSIMVGVTSSFLASGESVLLGALCVMSPMFARIIALEKQELKTRPARA